MYNKVSSAYIISNYDFAYSMRIKGKTVPSPIHMAESFSKFWHSFTLMFNYLKTFLSKLSYCLALAYDENKNTLHEQEL